MRRRGVVLVLVLLVVLALELLAMSAFGFARIAGLGAQHALNRAVLAAAAEDAAADALAGLDAAIVAQHAPQARLPLAVPAHPPLSTDAVAVVLAHGVVFVRATVRAPDGTSARAVAFGRVLTPADLLAAFPAVVSVLDAPATPLPVVLAGDTACDAHRREARPVLPFVAVRSPGDTLPLGDVIGIRWHDAARIAGATPADSLAAFVVHRGDVSIDSASAGVLLVDGNALLRARSQFTGILVVRGVLTLEAEARVAGVVRAAQVAPHAAGRLAYDACAVDRAVAASAFRRVYRITPRWRLPAR